MKPIPPHTFEERVKRALTPPWMELARITQRELRHGEPGLRLLPFLVDPDRAAIDAGANRGIWTGLMVRHCRTVWAFEPNPKLYAFLQSALGEAADCRQVALSDRDGEAPLMVPGADGRYSNQHASLSAAKVAAAPHMDVPVRVARLDSLDPPPVGFMKVDVEGHERQVIEGARGVIERDRPAMIVEIEERHTGRDLGEDLDFYQSLGYAAFGMRKGHLVPRARLDIGRDHREAVDAPGYVNNFVFLPA